jgi:hypothetical protein
MARKDLGGIVVKLVALSKFIGYLKSILLDRDTYLARSWTS